MSHRYGRVVVLVILVALCLSPAQGQAKRKTPGKSGPVANGPRFTERDRDTITKYFHSPYSNLPSSLKNGGTDVPPNVRKQVVRSGTLPPEVRPLALPPPLESRLPRLPKPYQRAVVGPDVIILNGKTQQISDVMQSVLIPAHGMYN